MQNWVFRMMITFYCWKLVKAGDISFYFSLFGVHDLSPEKNLILKKLSNFFINIFFRPNQVQLNRVQEFSTPREWKFQRVGGKMTVGGRWRVGGWRMAGSWRDLRFQGCCLRLLLLLQWLCHPRYPRLF